MLSKLAAPTQRRLVPRLALLALALGATLLAWPSPAAAQPRQDIVDTALAAGQFTTLARAVQAAGLVATLKGPGPYTVFAPTDAAFARLPAGTLDQLMRDQQQLRALLTYHALSSRLTAADLSRQQTVTTIQGQPIRLGPAGGSLRLNDLATVTQADLEASNGIIHVVDAVLLPPGFGATGQAGGAAAGGSAQPAPVQAPRPAALPRTGGLEPRALAPLGLGAALAFGGLALRRTGRRKVQR